MKKFKILIATFALIMSVLPTFANATSNRTNGEISIAIDEPFSSIHNITRQSSSADQIFTMAYDRLFYFDNGSIVSDIALSYELVSLDDISEASLKTTSDKGYAVGLGGDYDFEVPPCPREWVGGYAEIPGMLDKEELPDTLNFLTWGNGVLQIILRDDVVFCDGEPLTAYDVQNLIDYAKEQPENKLIRKQWEVVTHAEAIDDVTLNLSLNYVNCGYIDFIYSLTTPIASIVKINGEEVIGTGAYVIETFEENSARLARRTDWWKGELNTSVDYVNFYYYENKSEQIQGLINGDLDLSVSAGNVSDVQERIADGELTLELQVPTNPVVLLMNNDDFWLSSWNVRAAVFTTLNADRLMAADGNMVNASYDYWSLDNRNYPTGYATDKDYLEASQIFLSNVGMDKMGIEINEENKLPISIIYSDNINLAEMINETMNWKSIGGTNDERDESWFESTLCQLTDEEFDSDITDGNYQLALSEIELKDIDSAYNMLYGKSTTNMDKLINAMKLSADIGTFKAMHKYIQAERVNNCDMYIVGWRYKTFISNGSVSGFKTVNAYNPVSLISYVDFRGIDLAT